jgi:ribonuclease HII
MAVKPTEKEEFEKAILAKCQAMTDKVSDDVGKLREDTISRINVLNSILTSMQQLIKGGQPKETTLADKILAYMGSNLNKQITITEIIKNTTQNGDGKAVDAGAAQMVADELIKLRDSGEYGVGNFGNNVWMMVSKKDGNMGTPPSAQPAS